jgi:hypothetical protein
MMECSIQFESISPFYRAFLSAIRSGVMTFNVFELDVKY